MKLGRWELGWSRNVAVGILWTRDGKVGFVFFGLMAVLKPKRMFDKIR